MNSIDSFLNENAMASNLITRRRTEKSTIIYFNMGGGDTEFIIDTCEENELKQRYFRFRFKYSKLIEMESLDALPENYLSVAFSICTDCEKRTYQRIRASYPIPEEKESEISSK